VKHEGIGNSLISTDSFGASDSIMILRLRLPSSEGPFAWYWALSALSVRSAGIQFPLGYSLDVMEQTDATSDRSE
jgi:hypothetical protein